MEPLISALQSVDLDLKDPQIRSAICTLTTRLDAQCNLSAEQDGFLATLTHAVICKTATSPGGEPLSRALHASAVAFALTSLEKKVKADTFAAETSAPNPLALLELLEAATVKEKAEAQRADAQAAASKYAEEQPLFGGESRDNSTPVPAPLGDARDPSLASALRWAVQLENGHSQGLRPQNETWLPLAKDLPSATLHHAILHTRLVQRILAICDALLQPLATSAPTNRPRTWHAVRRHLSLASQLMLYLEEILLLQAPVHIATEVESWLVLIASQIGAVYRSMLESLQNPEPVVDGNGEEGPSELLLVNELLGVAETARVSPVVLVNLKMLLAATLIDTTGRLEMPDLETLLEPGSAFSDAHESLPHSGEEHASPGGSSPDLGPSVVSLAVQLIQEVDEELAPSDPQSGVEPETGQASDTLASLVSSFEPRRLIRLPRSEPFLGAFEWRRKHSRESLLGLILPPAGKWLDRLVAMLLVNPDQEGYGPEERSEVNVGLPDDGGAAFSRSQSTKSAPPPKEDNLFGDLFQEAMGSRGVSEASHRELPVDLHPPAKEVSHGGWAEAAIQVAQFLGGCAFDSRWCPAVLDASCSLLRKEHLAAIVTTCAASGAGGLGSGALRAALCKLVEALTVQDGRLAETPGLVRELAVQLYTQGARSDVLLAILAKWLLQKDGGAGGAAVASGEAADKEAGKRTESEEAPLEGDGASLRALVTAIWEAVFQSIGSLAVSPISDQQPVVLADAELSPLEHALASLPNQRQVSVLFLGFHLFERADRVGLLTAAVEHLKTAAKALKLQAARQAGKSGSGDSATFLAGHQLAVSRLVLLAGSLLGHLDRYPGWLPGQLQSLLELASSKSPGSVSNPSYLSLTASLAQQIGAASNSLLADKALAQSLFLLGQPDAPASEREEEASRRVAEGGAPPDLVASFSRSLLWILASPRFHCGSTTELLIDRYLSEVCWRNLRSWPLPLLSEADSAEATTLQLAELLEEARPSSPREATVELLSSVWSAVRLGSASAGHENDALAIGTLTVLEAGLRERKAGDGARPWAAQWSESFGQWLESKEPGAFLRELCTLLDGAADRYARRLRWYLEGCYGAEAAQLVMVLLRARLGNRASLEGALVKGGVSVSTVRLILQGGRRLLDGLSPASQLAGNAATDSSVSERVVNGVFRADSERWLEAAFLLPGFPSTAEVTSAPVASSQILIGAILSCMEGVLSLDEPGESGWSVVEEALSRATLTGLLDSEGALVNRIWASHPSLDAERATSRELDHSVTLCQTLLQQRVVGAPGQQAPALAHPSPPPLEKHLDTVLEALTLDLADKLEALLDEPTGRGLTILLEYFSGKAGEAGESGRASSAAATKPNSGHDAVGAGLEPVKGDLSFLLSALSNSPSSLLNGRILGLLVKILSPQKDGVGFGSTAGGPSEAKTETGSPRVLLAGAIAHRLRAGLLGMGESGLATWLQERLLGSAGGSLTWHVPAQQRESAGQLLEALVHDSRDCSEDFSSQLLTALLSRLKPAYATFEAKSVDAYFELIVRLSADHPRLIQRTLEVTTDLLDAFALQAGSISAEQLGHVQRLLGFLGAVLNSAAATSAAQQQGVVPSAQEVLFRPGRAGHFERRDRSASRNRAPQVHEAIVESREEGRDEVVREDSEDEEEEDLISFGEEDEEEEAFEGDDETVEMEEDDFESGETSSDDDDAKLCTFGASGSNFIEQHWYFCYTCDLVISKGCCSTCARVCHQGHKVVYSKFSRFFCDCGAGGSRNNPCQALRPRGPRSDTSSNLRGQSSASAAPADRASARGRAFGETASDSGSEAWYEPQEALQSELFPKLRVDSGVLAFLEEKGLEAVLLKLCDSFADALGLGNGGLRDVENEAAFDFSLAGGLTQRNDIVTFARAHKYGTFETKLKMEYSSAREVKAAIASGAISKSLLTVSRRGKVAIAEGDKVSLFEAAVLTAASADKGAPKPLSKNSVRFQILNLEFNPANDAHLVVSGFEDCQVFILNSRGEVTDRLAVELALEPETFVVQASWVPGSQVELLVVTNRSVKLYDLSKDKISPAFYVTVPQESIKQAVLARDSDDLLRIIVLTQQGVLFLGKLSPQEGSQGAISLTERLQLPPERQWPGSRGCSLSHFPEHRTLISSYEDGQVVIGRLADTFTSFEKVCFLSENERSGNLHFWRAVSEASGVYVAVNSARQGAAVAVQLAEGSVGTQTLRQVGGSSLLRMEGVATYAPPGSGQKSSILVLNDDGGLQVFSHAPAEVGDRYGVPGSAYVRGRVESSDRRGPQPAALAASFPLTFFENTQCITQSVTWGGDLGDSDAIKLSLAAEESFLEAPTARPFKILVNNSAAETVMVGCRIHVGATGRANVPSQVQVFDRTVVLEEGNRRWYDIPFTVVESLTADRSFTLTFGSAPNNQLSRIDAIEVYARSKEDFGWREKVESMRDLLQQNRAGPSATAAPPTDAPAAAPVSPIEEGLCAGLEVLGLFYGRSATGGVSPVSKHTLSPRLTGHDHFEDAVEEQSDALDDTAAPNSDRSIDPSPGCLALLEKAVSASEPHPSVQAFAQRVLSSLHPGPSELQRAKDALLMSAFANSVGPCARALSQGGHHARARAAHVLGSQMHWASEIASQRFEHFREAVARQGPGFSDELVGAFEAVVGKESLEATELSALTIDLVEVLCGCAQEALAEIGEPAARGSLGSRNRELESTGSEDRAASGAAAGPTGSAASVQQGSQPPSEKESQQREAQTARSGPERAEHILCVLQALLFSPQEPVRSAASVALSSHLLQSKLATSATPLQPLAESGPSQVVEMPARAAHVVVDAVQFSCDGCSACPIMRRRWHCTQCPDFDLCERCYEGRGERRFDQHRPEHPMVCLPVDDPFSFTPIPNPRSVAEASSHPLSDSGDDSDEASEPAEPQPVRSAGSQTAEAASSVEGQGQGTAYLAIEEMSEEEHLKLALELSMQETQPDPVAAAPKDADAGRSLVGRQAVAGSGDVTGGAVADGSQEAGQVGPSSANGASQEREKEPPATDPRALFRKMLLESFASDVGWMHRCSGLEAVPILQLLARLASERAPGGTLGLDGFDVRRLVEAMLRELNLGVSLPVESRSDWGEVAVLTLKFFAFVLTDWESADGEPGTGVEGHKRKNRPEAPRAADGPKEALRQPGLLEYLLSVLQRLVPEFAKPKREKSGGPGHDQQGALLHSRHDKTLSSLQPFFPDAYTRAHGRGVFAEFPKLVLGAALDLAEALTESGVKIDGGALAGKDGSAPEGPWADVLCSYIYCSQTHFVRDSARHVLLQSCGRNKPAFNLARDNWLLGKELQQLQRLSDKSDGFQRPLPHDKTVKLVKCLGVLAETAEKRPRSWQWFCSPGKTPDALTFLLRASYLLGEEAVLQALKLLALALAEEKEEGAPPSARPSAEFLLGNPTELDRFVRFFLLDFGAKAVRVQARAVLQNAWLRADSDAQRGVLVASIVSAVPELSSYGTNVHEISGLLKWLFAKGAERDPGGWSAALTLAGVSARVLDALRAHNRLLETHPNGRAYGTLQSLIEFDGYYLESEPCTACNNVEVPFSKLKLESIKQETKYTDNRILVRCPSSYTLESFSMAVHDARRSKSVKVLRLYYNNRAASDLSELKGNWALWKKVKSYHLAPNQAELKAELTVPVTGCNFMFEFAELYENLQASSLEHLQCPRCSRHVTDRHGICPHCHENCFQCRQCRNINYENLDSFLCNECGYSKYGRFEFSVNAKPSFAFDAIESEDDMQKCLAVIEKESENAHKQYQQLLATKKPLLRLISMVGDGSGDQDAVQVAPQVAAPSSSSPTLKVNQNVAVLGVLYGNKCKEAFEQVSRSVQALHGARKALTAYLERSSSSAGTTQAPVLPTAPKRPPSRCYGCASTLVTHALEWLHLLADSSGEKQKMVDQGLVQELFESGIHHGSQQVRSSTRLLICTLVRDNPAASESLTSLIRQRVYYCLDHPRTTELAVQAKNDCQLLRDACSLNDSCWEPRLKLAFEILFRGVEVGTDSPPIAENVILSCLRIVAQACTVPAAGSGNGNGKGADAASKPGGSVVGGLSQAFSSLGQASTAGGPDGRRSFAQVASGAVRQETRGAQSAATSWPQPARPPPTRPAPLVVAAESQPGPRLERSEKGGLTVTYKEWSNGSISFETLAQQQRGKAASGATNPSDASNAPARVSTPLRLGSLKLRPEVVTRRVVSKWRGARARRQLGALDRDSWLKGLVLSASSPAIRTEACALVRTLSASGSPARRLKFLDLMTELLTSARHARAEAVVEYFELYRDMLAEEDGRLYLTVKGWLRSACGLIVSEVHRIRAQEGNYLMANVNEGFVLQHVIGFLRSFLEIGTIRHRFVRDGLLTSLLEALLSLKSLVIQKTKLTASCAQELSGLLEMLLETGEDTQRSFVRACMGALEAHAGANDEHRGGQRAATFIMNQLCDVIQPVRPEPVYLLTLNKAHTQEEFIRGAMAQNPYSSADVGPLMRDVKNKICTQLEMLGLIEDDYGMELLVAGSIVSLDLSIKQVYEKVWLRTQQAMGVQSLADCPPMSVTYRLQGLDGEATEPMISEVDDDRGEQLDPEVEFALTGEMETCGGLELLLKILRESPQGRGELGALLKLLGFCCKVRTNRRTLLRLDALHVLLERARAAVSVSSPEQDGTAEALLEIIESLVTEANEMAAGGLDNVTLTAPTSAGVTTPRGRSWAGEAREEEAVAAVKMFLDKLSYRPSPVQGGRNAPDSRGGKQKDVKSQADAVARILPYLTYGEPAAMECLIGHFAPFMDFQEFDRLCAADGKQEEAASRAADHRQRLESFVKVCESIRLDANGDLLKSLFLERGLVARGLHYLKDVFPPVTSAGAVALEIRSVPAFTEALLLPSVPIVLGMLTGLANGHPSIQGLMDRDGVLPLLHALEGVSSEQKEIRAKAEGVLDIVSDEASGGALTATVNALRKATKDELRVRAMKRREAMLKGLGMASAVTSDGADRIVVSAKPSIEGLDEMEEEGDDSLACMVCREGYKLKPAECLGTYAFSKRVNGGGMLGARSEFIYTTVSHFNVIHFTCHVEAKRADSKLKTPKKEWEGAALRNSETLANSIFPLRGPDVTPQNYSRYCDQYWENLAALGRADGSRFKLLAHDLAALLGRFASGGSFSVDSHGGSKESNAQLLPFMVQMGAYLLEQVGSSQRRALRKSLQAYLGVAETSRTPGPATPRRSSFADAVPTGPSSSTPELASTPGGSSLPPRSPAPPVARSLDESVHLMLILSLLLHSLKEWQKHRREFLQRAIHFAYNQTRESRPLMPVPPSPSPGGSLTDLSSLFTAGPLVVQTPDGGFDPRAAFKAVKPIAIMVALIDKLQKFFKKGGAGTRAGEQEPRTWAAFPEPVPSPGQTPDDEELSFSFSRGSSTPRTPGEASPLRRGVTEGRDSGAQRSPSRRPSSEDSGDHSWELVMKERLNDIPAMLAFAKEFQELVEDLHAAEDLMELLDTVDCLGDIYGPAGGGSWEEFLEQTVTGVTPRASFVS